MQAVIDKAIQTSRNEIRQGVITEAEVLKSDAARLRSSGSYNRIYSAPVPVRKEPACKGLFQLGDVRCQFGQAGLRAMQRKRFTPVLLLSRGIMLPSFFITWAGQSTRCLLFLPLRAKCILNGIQHGLSVDFHLIEQGFEFSFINAVKQELFTFQGIGTHIIQGFSAVNSE